jgi:hypothetical protein
MSTKDYSTRELATFFGVPDPIMRYIVNNIPEAFPHVEQRATGNGQTIGKFFLMSDMDPLVKRVRDARQGEEKILEVFRRLFNRPTPKRGTPKVTTQSTTSVIKILERIEARLTDIEVALTKPGR